MPTVTVHYDSWVQLPERVVRSLGLRTGDRLEVEQAEGSVLLRASKSGKGIAEPSTEPPPPSPIIEEHTGEDAGTVLDEQQQVEPAVPAEGPAPKPRARGRRKAQA